MPKEELSLTKFGLGMITSIDPQDVPLESAIYSENLDSNAFGRLQGITANLLKFSSVGISAIGINSWLKREDGKYDLIYTDGTNIKSIRDFYGTPTDNTEIENKVPTSIVRLNRGMHIGTGSASNTPPQFLGWGGDFSPFGGIGLSTFTGTGTDNALFKGLYTGPADAVYHFKITGTGTPDRFRWSKDAGAYNDVDINIDTTWQDIAEGIKIMFATTTGHAVNDIWDLVVYKKKSVSMISHSGELSTYENDFNDATPDNGKFSLDFSGTDVRIWAGFSGSATANFNKRITAVNIYRSDDSSGYHRWKYSLIYDGIQETLLSTNYIESSASFNEDEAGLYRLIKSVLIADGDEWQNDTIYGYVDVDDTTAVYTLAPTGVSYEQNSGLLENADTNLPYYELGCTLNNFHFVSKCYVDKIPDAKMMLFRSVEFCYDVFDIYNDKVPLNILPTAMAGFNNKIYVWDNNTTIIINASNLSIENIISGTGCLSQQSWIIIDTLLDNKPYRALVWADSHDIYMDEGAGARPISDAIRTRINSTTVSWADMQHSSMNPILVFDAPKNTLLCISTVNYSGAVASVMAYNITNGRWDYFPDFCNYSSTSRLCKSAFSGKNGETYCVNGYQVLDNFSSTATTVTNRAWKYYSPELTLGLPKQPKMFYNLYLDKVETSGTITPTYSVNKGNSYAGLTNTTEIKTDGNWEKQNSIILVLTGTAGTNWVNAMELIYRKMVGIR